VDPATRFASGMPRTRIVAGRIARADGCSRKRAATTGGALLAVRGDCE
jgi:hypothetical protein